MTNLKGLRGSCHGLIHPLPHICLGGGEGEGEGGSKSIPRSALTMISLYQPRFKLFTSQIQVRSFVTLVSDTNVLSATSKLKDF